MLGSHVAQIEVLPASCRRRLQWWQSHTALITVVCVLAALAAVSMQATKIIG
ncbi:MAG: hypothetical protein ABI301_07270 [Jatrophihabitantaceae bacterium]